MNSNFFNLQQNCTFEEAVFQCELGESLGLTRSCYLCSHYVLKSLTIDFDIDCKTLSSKENKLELWSWKLLESIEEREGQNLEIFIKTLGAKATRSGYELYSEYFIPINPAVPFIQHTVNISHFTEQFYDSSTLE